jgi:hypothetical protein
VRTEKPTTDQWGGEVHPAFGMIGASRISISAPGTSLFDSDILHHHTVRIRIMAASRKRQLNHDYIHGGEQYIEVELSEAQWASFVSSMNVGDGVPCTIRRMNYERIPEFPYDPRLAHSIQETKDAASRAFQDIKDAMAAYENLDPKAGAKEKREALSNLHHIIENAAPNVNFAGKSLIEMTENVVQKARADVEAFVVSKARQLGLDPSDIGTPFALAEENHD